MNNGKSIGDILASAAQQMEAEAAEAAKRPRPLDPTCLSFWFPKIRDAGLPVPRTEIVQTDIPLWMWIDGQEPTGLAGFLAELRAACLRIPGPPWFLRTGQGSGKHNWDDCCNLRDIERLHQHVYNLFEWSHLVDFMGLATDVWVVREMLPVEPLAYLSRYGNMPVVQEWRCFVRDGRLECCHFYWPFYRPWMARVVQGAEFRNQTLPLLNRFWSNNTFPFSRMNAPTSESLKDVLGIIDSVEVIGNILAQFHDDFSLSLLDPKVGQKRFRYLGCLPRRHAPIPEWLASLSRGWNPLEGWPTKGVKEKLHSFFLDLFDLDERYEGKILCAPLLGTSDLNAETSVGVQESRTVREDGWVLFHEEETTTQHTERQVLLTFFPECPISAAGGAPGWRNAIEYTATLRGAEYAALSDLAQAAGNAVGGGYWSVDILKTRRGPYVTDMAEGEKSYHWEGCEYAR